MSQFEMLCNFPIHDAFVEWLNSESEVQVYVSVPPASRLSASCAHSNRQVFTAVKSVLVILGKNCLCFSVCFVAGDWWKPILWKKGT